jgi:MutS domain V
VSPSEAYTQRLDFWRAARARAETKFRQLGNARLLTGIAAVAIAGCSFGAGWISAWWLLAPLVAFIALAMVHDRVDRSRACAGRGIAYFEHVLGRLSNAWIGRGNQGERFRDPKHVYADDLDLFGRGSLFELLSTARTATGENTLARWLLGPGEYEEVIARQESVAELRPRVDLREEFALMGEDIRAAIDADALAEWGAAPPAFFFKHARVVALVLAVVAFVTFALFLAHLLNLVPFLFVVLFEMGFSLAIRDVMRSVAAKASAPARELRLVSLLLERLERELFASARLANLKRELATDGHAASREIARLQKMVDQLETAQSNMFFRPIGAPLLWTEQYSMAIEAWRRRFGPRVGRWMEAIGEFEALCSLASFAYERPEAAFPELIADGPRFEATALAHPLIAPGIAVPNDVGIGGELRLLIVSGSNMSGKSTLLRAIGLSAVLAWAGAPVTAGRLRVSRLYIGASMRANDSVTDNRSRFYAEISRLRDVVDLARAGRPTLFLLDELLSGTNSHDRRIGAESLVRGLVERGAVGFVTTHDLALAQIAETLDGHAKNVHFEDHLEGGEIRFDYRLRQGVVTRSNALELMRAVGLEV